MPWLIFYFARPLPLQEGAKAYYRVKHSENEFAKGHKHINGVENFWGFAKFRLAKFRGIKRENFVLHLKETELNIMPKI